MIALPRMMSVGDDAAENCGHLVIDPPSPRDADLDPAPEGQHVDHRLPDDLRVAEIDLATAHDRNGIAAGEIARCHPAADAAHDCHRVKGVRLRRVLCRRRQRLANQGHTADADQQREQAEDHREVKMGKKRQRRDDQHQWPPLQVVGRAQIARVVEPSDHARGQDGHAPHQPSPGIVTALACEKTDLGSQAASFVVILKHD